MMEKFIIKKNKKGDMTIQVVVMAALALIFLVVVAFVMTGKITLFSKHLGDCENKDGRCVSEGNCYGTESSFTCPEKTDVCCLNTCEGKGGTCDDSCSGEEIYFAACKESDQSCCE